MLHLDLFRASVSKCPKVSEKLNIKPDVVLSVLIGVNELGIVCELNFLGSTISMQRERILKAAKVTIASVSSKVVSVGIQQWVNWKVYCLSGLMVVQSEVFKLSYGEIGQSFQ